MKKNLFIPYYSKYFFPDEPYKNCFNHFPNKPWCLQIKYFENTLGKGEMA